MSAPATSVRVLSQSAAQRAVPETEDFASADATESDSKMRRSIPTRALIVFVLPLLTWHCSDAGVAREPGDVAEGSDDSAEQGSDLDPSGVAVEYAGATADVDACRSFTASAVLDVGLDRGSLECSFDTTTLRHACNQGIAGSSLTTTRTYASVADFVEAGRHIGKVTSLDEVRSAAGQVVRLSHYYDELGRLVRSVEERPLGDVIHRYRDYDDAGRPRQELASGVEIDGSACASLAVGIVYDDALGTVVKSYQAAQGCDFPVRRQLELYDAVGNPLRIEVDQGSGPETRLQATPSALQSVCP
jgi:hypothetical protein